jgi:cytochrome P450
MKTRPRYAFEDRLAQWSTRRETEPVYFDEEVQKWRLLDYAAVARVLSDPATFSSDVAGLAPVQEDFEVMRAGMFVTMDPPRHRKLRTLVSQAFTPGTIAALEPRVRAITSELLDDVAGASRIDLCSALAFPLPVMVISELLGIPAADREVFEKWARILFSDNQLPEAPTMAEIEAALAQITPIIREMTGYIRDHIRHHREHPDDGLTSKLVAVEVNGERLEDEEIIGFVALLLVAGHITTTALIGNTALCLDRHPEAALALRADPGRLPTALEEVLRCLPPFNELGRRTNAEVTLGGRIIAPDSIVAANLASANRDPAQFTDPEVFDIDRSPNPHLAFGHGIHFCLGAPLARLEGRVAFEELLGRYREMAIAADEPVEFQNEAVIISAKKLILDVS